MKLIFIRTLKLFGLAVLLSLALSGRTQAQDARVQIPNLDRLEARAAEVVDISIDERMLQLAMKFLSDKDPDEAKVKSLVAGLKGVYVKVLEFDKNGEFTQADYDSFRMQLRSPGWSRMVGVKSKREQQDVEVYMMMTGNQIGGLAVIATEPRELVIINIVGPIDIDKLSQLSGNFGIPRIHLRRTEREE